MKNYLEIKEAKEQFSIATSPFVRKILNVVKVDGGYKVKYTESWKGQAPSEYSVSGQKVHATEKAAEKEAQDYINYFKKMIKGTRY